MNSRRKESDKDLKLGVLELYRATAEKVPLVEACVVTGALLVIAKQLDRVRHRQIFVLISIWLRSPVLARRSCFINPPIRVGQRLVVTANGAADPLQGGRLPRNWPSRAA